MPLLRRATLVLGIVTLFITLSPVYSQIQLGGNLRELELVDFGDKLKNVAPPDDDTNYPPFLEEIPDVHLVPGRAWQMEFSASDPNRERVYFDFSAGPDLESRGATFQQNGSSGIATFSWTPAVADVGLASLVEVVAKDRAGADHRRLFKVTVDPAEAPEVISGPIILGPRGGRTNQTYTFKALSYSNHSLPPEFNFTVTKPDHSSDTSGWQSSNLFNLDAVISGTYTLMVSARSRENNSIITSGQAAYSFVVTTSGLTLPTQTQTLEVVGENQFRFKFYSSPLNRGLLRSYNLMLRASLAGQPLQQITIPVTNLDNEPLVYSQLIDLTDIPNWQRIFTLGRLVINIDAVRTNGTVELYARDLFPTDDHLFPEILSTAISGINNNGAVITATVSNPGGFYSPQTRLYENNLNILTNSTGEFTLTDLLPNHSYANYSAKALNPSLGTESVAVTVPTFRTGFVECSHCWQELNGGQPVDAGEPLSSDFHDFGLVGGTVNGEGDYIYLFNSESLVGTVAGRLNLQGQDSITTGRWELFTKDGWSEASNDIARSISDGILRYNGLSLYPDPAYPRGEGVFGVSSGNRNAEGIFFPYSTSILDTHGFLGNVTFNGRDWTNWIGGQNYDATHAGSLIPTWNNGDGSFAMGPNSNGLLVGTTGYGANRFYPQLTATRYSGPRVDQPWNLWNNLARTWTSGNYLPWWQGASATDVSSAFVLNPQPDATTEEMASPQTVYLGDNNYLTVFSYKSIAANNQRDIISSALYDDNLRQWSWWGSAGWQVGAPYTYQAVTGGTKYDLLGSQLLSAQVGQADFLYLRGGRLAASFYQHSSATVPVAAWAPATDLGPATSFRAITGPDNSTWVFYTTDVHNVFLRIKNAEGTWSAPEQVYSSVNDEVEVAGAALVQQTPLVFLEIDRGQGARLYALSREDAGDSTRERSNPVSHRQSAPAVVNLDTRRVRLSPQSSRMQSFAGALAMDNEGYIYSPNVPLYYVLTGKWSDFINRQTHQWGESWNLFQFPAAIAVDNTRGKVYIADRVVSGGGSSELHDSSSISIVDIARRGSNLNWDPNNELPRFGSGGYISGLAVDEVRALLYASNTLNHEIQVYDISSETPVLLRSFGRLGTGTGQFKLPKGLATDGDGNLYVSDSGNHRIQKFDPEGNHLLAWGSHGRGANDLLSPDNIAVDPTYNLVYVIDQGNRTMKSYNKTGDFIYAWNKWREGTGNNDLSTVGGVVADGAGGVYVGVDQFLHKFEIVSPEVDEDDNNIPDSLEAGTLSVRFNASLGNLNFIDDTTTTDDSVNTNNQNDERGGGGGGPRGPSTPTQQPLVVQLMLRLIELLRQLLALLLAART